MKNRHLAWLGRWIVWLGILFGNAATNSEAAVNEGALAVIPGILGIVIALAGAPLLLLFGQGSWWWIPVLAGSMLYLLTGLVYFFCSVYTGAAYTYYGPWYDRGAW